MADELMENEEIETETEAEQEPDESPEERVEEEEDESESLDSVLTEDEGKDSKEQSPEETGESGSNEPGYIKGRINKAVQKAVAETEARMRVEFEKQLAPFRERMLDDEAKELVRTGKIKDLDMAKEFVRYRQGMPPAPSVQEPDPKPQAQQPPQGQQFSPEVTTRANMLSHQADVIRERRGIDVMDAFNNDEEVRQNVISGKWDFYDAVEAMASRPQKKKAPSPMRSPNGASGAEKSTISSMSDEQFERMEKKIKGGTRYAIK